MSSRRKTRCFLWNACPTQGAPGGRGPLQRGLQGLCPARRRHAELLPHHHAGGHALHRGALPAERASSRRLVPCAAHHRSEGRAACAVLRSSSRRRSSPLTRSTNRHVARSRAPRCRAAKSHALTPQHVVAATPPAGAGPGQEDDDDHHHHRAVHGAGRLAAEPHRSGHWRAGRRPRQQPDRRAALAAPAGQQHLCRPHAHVGCRRRWPRRCGTLGCVRKHHHSRRGPCA